MLSELCGELRNWFESDTANGTFTIKNGSIEPPDGFLADGQYFRIIGSVFNDGVYRYPADTLTDEVFEGTLVSMAIPPEVLKLNDEIDEYTAKYRDVVDNPYTSESFGGYTYSKSSYGTTNDSSWRTVFKSRLNRWRKL